VATVSSLNLPVRQPGLGWRKTSALAAALAGGLIFWLVAALPYLMLDQAKLGQYASRRAWVLLHIAAGTFALLAGPVQLWLGLSDRRLDVHRRLGQLYMGAVLVARSRPSTFPPTPTAAGGSARACSGWPWPGW
jgi:hypothetical protein